MKLILDGKKLKGIFKKMFGRSREMELSVAEMKGILKDCLLDPADLKAMNLAALWVLGELKAYLKRGKEYWSGNDQLSNPEKESIYDFILKHIADLESSADLGAAKKTEEEAKAWNDLIALYKKGITSTSPGRKAIIGQVLSFIAERYKEITQARAELALPTSARAKEGEKSHG